MKRRRMGRRESRRNFRRGAMRVKGLNNAGGVMRGGIRL